LAELTARPPDGFPRVEQEHRIDGRVMQPQVGELVRREQRDVGLRVGGSELKERRGGHDRVAQPIDATHDEARDRESVKV
jgi:hypothetical protein